MKKTRAKIRLMQAIIISTKVNNSFGQSLDKKQTSTYDPFATVAVNYDCMNPLEIRYSFIKMLYTRT